MSRYLALAVKKSEWLKINHGIHYGIEYMNVTIFGIGYVGLVQAAVFADAGNHVICVDVDKDKVKNLKKGIIPIFEPRLASIIEANYNAGRL
jgi:UDPglucose 6-dehydrogenase